MKTQFVFKYVYENDHDGDMYLDDYANNKEVVVTLNGEQSLTQIFEEFRGFLQSAGYTFGVNDYIDKISNLESYPSSNEDYEEESSSPQTDDEEWDSKTDTYSDIRDSAADVESSDKLKCCDDNAVTFDLPQYDTTSGRDLDEEELASNEASQEILNNLKNIQNIDLSIPTLDEEELKLLEDNFPDGIQKYEASLNNIVDTLNNVKIKQLEEEIIPFLESLKKEPEKNMIHWPNRTETIDKRIQKIKSIIGE
jgi:hypothetical protein